MIILWETLTHVRIEEDGEGLLPLPYRGIFSIICFVLHTVQLSRLSSSSFGELQDVHKGFKAAAAIGKELE